MGAHDAGQTDKAHASRCHLVRQTNQPRQGARHFHNGDLVLAPKSIRASQAHDEIQGLVGNLRERMGGIQPHRNQQRTYLFLKVLLHPPPLHCAALPVGHDANSLGCKRRAKHVVVQRILTHDQLVNSCRKRLQRSRAVDAFGVTGLGRRDMRGHPHLKKLIQVR